MRRRAGLCARCAATDRVSQAAARTWLGPQAAESARPGMPLSFESRRARPTATPPVCSARHPSFLPRPAPRPRFGRATPHGSAAAFDFIPLLDEGEEVVGVLALGILLPAGVRANKPLVRGEATPARAARHCRSCAAIDRTGSRSTVCWARRRPCAGSSPGVVGGDEKASVLILGPTAAAGSMSPGQFMSSRPPGALGPLVPWLAGCWEPNCCKPVFAAWPGPKATIAPGALATLLMSDVDQNAAGIPVRVGWLSAHWRVAVRIVSTARRPLTDLAEMGNFRPTWPACCRRSLSSCRRWKNDLMIFRCWRDVPRTGQCGGVEATAGFSPEALDALAGYAGRGNWTNWPRSCRRPRPGRLARGVKFAICRSVGPGRDARRWVQAKRRSCWKNISARSSAS